MATHPLTVGTYSDVKQFADDMANMTFKRQVRFIELLANKFHNDSLTDRDQGRVRLANFLQRLGGTKVPALAKPLVALAQKNNDGLKRLREYHPGMGPLSRDVGNLRYDALLAFFGYYQLALATRLKTNVQYKQPAADVDIALQHITNDVHKINTICEPYYIKMAA